MAFPDGTRIQKLLEADAHNATHSPDITDALDPLMVGLFEETAALFRALMDRLQSWSVEATENAKLAEIAKELGVTDEQLINRLRTTPHDQPPKAQQAWALLSAYHTIKMLILGCQRYWAWASTDLARRRLSTATGYLRLEAEIIGLIKLFLAEPELADRWFRIASKKEGKRFFKETQVDVMKALEEFELASTYDIASGGSQHVRLSSMARSVVSKNGELKLPDQDFDSEDPYNFHLTVAHFHKVQGRIFLALTKLLPDVADGGWKELYSAFATHINQLWAVLEKAYGDRMKNDNGEGA